MVGVDVQQDPHLGPELANRLQLKRAHLKHQPVRGRLFQDYPGNGRSVVARGDGAQPGGLERFREPLHQRALSVGPGDRDNRATAAAPSEFKFGKHRQAALASGADPRRGRRYARARHANIEIAARPLVSARDHLEAFAAQGFGLRGGVRRGAVVQHHHARAVRAQQPRRGCAARAATQHDRLAIRVHHRIFNVATPTSAKMMERIQNRVVIMVSTTSTSRPSRSAASFSSTSK